MHPDQCCSEHGCSTGEGTSGEFLSPGSSRTLRQFAPSAPRTFLPAAVAR